MDDDQQILLVADGVIRIRCPNPSPFTLTGTNVYLIGTGPRRVLIDAGQDCTGYDAILENAKVQYGIASIDFALLTHHHHDHITGLATIRRIFGDFAAFKCTHPDDSQQFHDIEDGQRFQTACNLEIVAFKTPGHTSDHCVFYLPLHHILFSGDCVLGSNSSTVFTDLQSFLCSLEQLVKMSAQFRMICPGHGSIIDNPSEKLLEYINHRKSRNNEIMEVVKVAPATHEEIYARMYPQVPEGLSRASHHVLSLHLQYLTAEHKIQKHQNVYHYALP